MAGKQTAGRSAGKGENPRRDLIYQILVVVDVMPAKNIAGKNHVPTKAKTKYRPPAESDATQAMITSDVGE
jgi:hypothetical protein